MSSINKERFNSCFSDSLFQNINDYTFQLNEVVQHLLFGKNVLGAKGSRRTFSREIKMAIVDLEDALALSRFSRNLQNDTQDLTKIRKVLRDLSATTKIIAVREQLLASTDNAIESLRDMSSRADDERRDIIFECLNK